MTRISGIDAIEGVSTTDSRRLVADIKDEGLFERLAASVLRISEPLYRGVCDTGTNDQGRTIADPADGIVFSRSPSGERFAIIAHHTITKRNRLREKWLDPTLGDLTKALDLFDGFKDQIGSCKRRLVVTCSTTPNSSLVTDLEAAAVHHGIEIDLWAGSRIADVLDIDPDGQWLRARTFGTIPQRLSLGLTRDIGRKMVEDACPQADPTEFIKRDRRKTIDDHLTSRNMLFLTGASGLGKSVLCYNLVMDVARSGGVCLVLTDRIIEEVSTLEEAFSRSLKAYAPALSEFNMESALLSCHPRGVLVWVEDINRVAAPMDLLRKLIRWAGVSEPASESCTDTEDSQRRIRFLCPIWPETLESLSKKERDVIDLDTVLLDEYSPDESSEAVGRRAERVGVEMTRLEAQEIAEQLNHDPLLIGLLSDWREPKPAQIISQYIDDEVTRVAVNKSYQKSEVFGVLNLLASSMLENREMSPSWSHVLLWMRGGSPEAILRLLVQKSSLVNVNDADRLEFRHDRIRNFLLSSFIGEEMNSDCLDSPLFDDPYFAKIVGEAALSTPETATVLERVDKIGPLAQIYAFAAAVRQDHPVCNELHNICKSFLLSEGFQQGPRAQKFAVHAVLAQLDGENILELLRLSPEKCFAKQEGMARNGDIKSAAAFCYTHDPHLNSPRRDRVLMHAVRKLGSAWVDDVGSFLKETNLDEKLLEGALFLAGELGHAKLIDPLERRWRSSQETGEKLTSGMLYAAIMCSAGRDNSFADEVVMAWDELPTKDPEKEQRNPRSDVAEYILRGGLRRHVNDRVIGYLIDLPGRIVGLKNTIPWLLRAIDHPDAVRNVVEAVVEIDRKIECTDGYNFWATIFTDNWRQDRYPNSRRMGSASREALRVSWINTNNDPWLRKRAFDLWSSWMTSHDISKLADSPPDGLEDRALAARLRHGDQSAKPDLARKIKAVDNDFYWLQFAQYVGTEGLEDTIALLFERRREFFLSNPEVYYNPDNFLPEILGDRDDGFALRIILKNWDQVGMKKRYVIALLYMATPESLAIVAEAIQAADDPTKLLEYIDSRLGIKTLNRPGITRLSQAKVLLPYIEYFSDIAKWEIWEVCNKRGWFEWRRRNLDQHMHGPADRAFPRIDENADFEWLDDQLESDLGISAEVHYWAKDRLEIGLTQEKLVDRAEKYASTRRNEDAYKFFANVVSELGTRSDLDRLDMNWARARHVCSLEYANASFAVRLRRCN